MRVRASEMDWAINNTCCALQSKVSISESLRVVQDNGFILHPDLPKNWDNAVSVLHALDTCSPVEYVLDTGAELYSAFLPSLREVGYKCLTGMNNAFQKDRFVDGIFYRYGDATGADLPDEAFKYITCLSVIEHGVNLPRFFSEQSRLLQSGGTLFVSFDYWEAPMETREQVAYGCHIKIFSNNDVQSMIKMASAYGLILCKKFNPSVDERVVHWEQFGLRYTFANLMFEKTRMPVANAN